MSHKVQEGQIQMSHKKHRVTHLLLNLTYLQPGACCLSYNRRVGDFVLSMYLYNSPQVESGGEGGLLGLEFNMCFLKSEGHRSFVCYNPAGNKLKAFRGFSWIDLLILI